MATDDQILPYHKLGQQKHNLNSQNHLALVISLWQCWRNVSVDWETAVFFLKEAYVTLSIIANGVSYLLSTIYDSANDESCLRHHWYMYFF